MSAVLDAVLPIFALVLAGVLCARRGVLGAGAVDSLNAFVVWLALPALLFQAMAQITWAELDHPGFLAAFGGAMMATFAVSLGLDRRGRLADRAIEGLDAAYANTGFMGIPLCLAVLGPASLAPAVIASLLTVCVLFAAAIALIETDLQGGGAGRAVLGRVGGSLARNPLLVAPALGLAVAATGVALPVPVLRFTTLLGAAASPCALVTIGLFLAQPGVRPGVGSGVRRGTVARLVALKLLGQPALTALLAFVVFPMPAAWSHTALLISALPTGTGPFMLARIYDRDAAATSRAILVSTVLSVATISVLVAGLD